MKSSGKKKSFSFPKLPSNQTARRHNPPQTSSIDYMKNLIETEENILGGSADSPPSAQCFELLHDRIHETLNGVTTKTAMTKNLLFGPRYGEIKP